MQFTLGTSYFSVILHNTYDDAVTFVRFKILFVQTGSGKTYTMWGPANALSEENLSGDQQGLTPRVFQRLFDRINEVRIDSFHFQAYERLYYVEVLSLLMLVFPLQEQIKHADKQLKYQCRCSFLEVK